SVYSRAMSNQFCDSCSPAHATPNRAGANGSSDLKSSQTCAPVTSRNSINSPGLIRFAALIQSALSWFRKLTRSRYPSEGAAEDGTDDDGGGEKGAPGVSGRTIGA